MVRLWREPRQHWQSFSRTPGMTWGPKASTIRKQKAKQQPRGSVGRAKKPAATGTGRGGRRKPTTESDDDEPDEEEDESEGEEEDEEAELTASSRAASPELAAAPPAGAERRVPLISPSKMTARELQEATLRELRGCGLRHCLGEPVKPSKCSVLNCKRAGARMGCKTCNVYLCSPECVEAHIYDGAALVARAAKNPIAFMTVSKFKTGRAKKAPQAADPPPPAKPAAAKPARSAAAAAPRSKDVFQLHASAQVRKEVRARVPERRMPSNQRGAEAGEEDSRQTLAQLGGQRR